MLHYNAFGLSLSSQFELPELLAITACDHVDVIIKLNPATPITQDNKTAIEIDKAKLAIPGVAEYRIESGRVITITPDPMAKREDINLFLLGSVMGLLLQQRDCLLLHACAIEFQGRAHLFAADSGVGKSTLAYGFYQRGYRILTDDVACISYASGRAMIHPGYPRLRLTQASADALKVNTADAPTVVTCDKKYILSCHNHWHTTPLQVASFTVIEPDTCEDVFQCDLLGVEKLLQLKHHSYRYGYLAAQHKLAIHFKQISQFAESLLTTKIKRPNDQFKIQELMHYIEAGVNNESLPV